MHFSGFMLNLQDLKNTSKFSTGKKYIMCDVVPWCKTRTRTRC